jgi:hypothetical protein
MIPAHITDLHVIVEAYCKAHPATRWGQLFEKLGREAINLQHLFVLLDAEGPIHRGLGNDLCFPRALVQLKVKRIITINGCYAKDLPRVYRGRTAMKNLAAQYAYICENASSFLSLNVPRRPVHSRSSAPNLRLSHQV